MSTYIGKRVSYPCSVCRTQFTLSKKSKELLNGDVICPKCVAPMTPTTTEEKKKVRKYKCLCTKVNGKRIIGERNLCPVNHRNPTSPETGRKREESIHTPVIRLMGRFGYGLLKDGDTFYQKGYELNPRIGITFSMKQAYAIQGIIRSTYATILAQGEKIGAEKERERVKKWVNENTHDFHRADDVSNLIDAIELIDALKGTL